MVELQEKCSSLEGMEQNCYMLQLSDFIQLELIFVYTIACFVNIILRVGNACC